MNARLGTSVTRYLQPLCWLAAFAAALAFTAQANSYYVFVMASVAMTALVGIGLNVLLGLAGQMSFGHVGFYALGAYVVAVLTVTLKWSFWIAMPLAGTLAALCGALLALPAVRVRGPYLAMVTIAFAFIVEQLAVEWRGVTGGQNGIMGIGQPALFGLALGERGLALLAIVVAGLATLGFRWLSLSRLGAAMRAVRDAELAAESIGLDPVRIKTIAFALSAGCAGVAGGFFAPLSGFVTPSSFGFSQSILFVLVVIIGGTASVAGPLLGALIVVLLPEALAGLAEYRLLFFGALLLLVLWLAPDGIAGALGRRWRLMLGSADSPWLATAEAVEVQLPPPLHRSGLQVEGLGIQFGGLRAVHAVALQAKPGAVTSVIGPNGAGKTTLLNMLGGFYRPDSGRIVLGERELQGLPAWRVARAGVARTYQTTQLFGSMSVLDNLLIATASDAADARGFAAALLHFVGYRGDAGLLAGELPHVDRRLVEIARALAMQPTLLLLDEPAAGLSRADKQTLASLLRRIADSGVCVVLVEHDMQLVMGISDHIVVLDAGLRIAAGAPEQVRQDAAVRKAYLGDDSVGNGSMGNGSIGQGAAGSQASSSADALLTVRGLRAGYGAGPVLQGLDVDIGQHEMVAMLGANGAGKSTLMRSIAGLHRPLQGSVCFAGEELSALPAHRVVAHGVVLVPEGRQVFPELSVLDNLELGGFLRRDALAADIESMLQRFPRLRERLHQRAGLLSGGEQQMLAIARGLMSQPRLLLLDEPSLGLAPTVIRDLFVALDRLRAEAVTLLLVDQMAGLTLALADRAYVLEDGQIVASGTAAEIAADGALEKAYLG